MDKANKIRVIAVAIIKNKNKVLVTSYYDKIKKQKFYRALGGGVEFGEKAEQALQREFKEEINCQLKNIKLLGVLENLFTFEIYHGHEIVFIFKADLEDKCIYKKKQFKILDSIRNAKAEWVLISEIKKARFYPEGIKKYI